MQKWQEAQFRTMDGLTLFYRYKAPKQDTSNTLLFLHRGHEHSARIMPFADALSDDEVWCFSFDLRGHGRSEGTRAWAENFDVWVKDLNDFVGHIRQQFELSSKDMVLIANSVGSVMAVSWILKYGPGLKGCILGAPAFSIKLYIPFALSFLKLARRFSDKLFVTSYVRSRLLTRSEKEAALYDSDKLITKKIGVNILTTLFDTVKHCFKRLNDFETPVLLLSAEKDYIVDNSYHDRFIKGISSQSKQHIVLTGYRHAIFHEIEQDKLLIPCQQFIESLSKDSKQLPSVIPQARPHTLVEYNKLANKGSPVELLYYGIYRLFLEKIGQFSRGVSLGLEYGFDSGVSLDYVYCNTSSGTNWPGKVIDRVYLNAIGWRGIRTRKYNIKQSLSGVLEMLDNEGIKPVILDIASGPGRYLFEIQKESAFPISLLLNDIDPNSLDQAKKLAKEFNSPSVSFTEQNAFDLQVSKLEAQQQPNVIIVSGLFELYESNPQVHNVLKQLYTLVSNGGYIIYTGQPWHPQIKVIGRVLNNRHGKRWVMRRRVQQEMDLLVESAGFNKLNTSSDSHGIFTVSCAQKLNKDTLDEHTNR